MRHRMTLDYLFFFWKAFFFDKLHSVWQERTQTTSMQGNLRLSEHWQVKNLRLVFHVLSLFSHQCQRRKTKKKDWWKFHVTCPRPKLRVYLNVTKLTIFEIVLCEMSGAYLGFLSCCQHEWWNAASSLSVRHSISGRLLLFGRLWNLYRKLTMCSCEADNGRHFWHFGYFLV